LRAEVGADVEQEKRLAAEAAAALVEDGMRVGLGTGSTVAYFLEALASRALDVRCVATSPATERRALELGLHVEPFEGADALRRLDAAFDGADQIAADGWVVKGGGGAHTREKIVAAAADRFVLMVAATRLVERVSPPIPLELAAYGLASTLERLGHARLRDAPPTPDGGVVADWLEPVRDPVLLADFLATTPGVVEHGLFEPHLVSEALVGRDDEVERVPGRRGAAG
jgi:ribose 5-phosphate isomerase A